MLVLTMHQQVKSHVYSLFQREDLLVNKAGGGRPAHADTIFSYGGPNMPKMQPSRSTVHINRHQAENVCHAFDYAKHIGQPLNIYVVINLNEAPKDMAAAAIFTKVVHKYRDWLKRRMDNKALAPAYVYTHENPDGHPHVNWAVHIPTIVRDEFMRKLPRWVERAQGCVRPYDIQVADVDPYTDKTLAKYIIKGTDTQYVPYLHLQDFAQPQGRVFGRRATSSVAIGRAARKVAGFVPKRHRHEWKKRVI